MKSRRLIASPEAQGQDIVRLQNSTLEAARVQVVERPPMSALGQKRTFRNIGPMSALPPKADIDHHGWNVAAASDDHRDRFRNQVGCLRPEGTLYHAAEPERLRCATQQINTRHVRFGS